MNEQQTDKHGDSLSRLIDAFVDQSVPSGPDELVKQRVLIALGQASANAAPTRANPSWGGPAMRRFVTVAALLLAVVATAAYVNSNSHRSSGAAFAAMINRMQQVRTARFMMSIDFKGTPKITFENQMLAPGWMYQKARLGDGEFIQISDMQAGKMLSLMVKERHAELVELKGMPESQRQKNWLDDFRKMTEDGAVFLGREDVDGTSALKYQYDKAGDHYTIWLNPASNLPVRIVATDVADGETVRARMTFYDVMWDVPIDESLFTLEPPEGYTLREQSLDLADAKAEDFVKMMRFFAKLENDRFPDELNIMHIMTSLMMGKPDTSKDEQLKWAEEKLAHALDWPEVVGLDEEEYKKQVMEKLQPIMVGGAVFMESTKQTHEWHYQGKGVKLGEQDKIILWWHPKAETAEKSDGELDADVANVMYGDLRIERKPVAELPAAQP